MSDSTGSVKCAITCYVMGALAGGLAVVMLVLLGEFSWPGAVFTGGLLAVVIGFFLSWLLCRPLPTLAEVDARHRSAAAPAAKAAPTPAPAPAPAAEAPKPAAVSAPVAAAPAAAPAAAARAAAAVSADASPTDADKPALLSAPRGGAADNLKEIKGVGPKMEAMLNKMGIYHFDQVANWTDREVAWVDENLEGFKGRVSRDNWVDQAKLLATGAETEFSKKVQKGDVY